MVKTKKKHTGRRTPRVLFQIGSTELIPRRMGFVSACFWDAGFVTVRFRCTGITRAFRATVAIKTLLTGGFLLGNDGGDLGIGLDHGGIDFVLHRLHLVEEVGIGLECRLTGRFQFLPLFRGKPAHAIAAGPWATVAVVTFDRMRRGARWTRLLGLRQRRQGKESSHGEEQEGSFHILLMTPDHSKGFNFNSGIPKVPAGQSCKARHKHTSHE